MCTLGNAFDIQFKTSEDRVFKAGNLVIELATGCLEVIDLCPQSTKTLQPFDKRTRGVWRYEGNDAEFREGEDWRGAYKSTD